MRYALTCFSSPPLSADRIRRAALQGAASVASLLITTEAMIAEAHKKEAAPAMPGGGGMGGMGGMDY